MKRLLFLLLLATFALFGEQIERFQTDLFVFNNQKALVKERIDYNFGFLQKHGIYLDIPKNDTKISNIKVLQNGKNAHFKLFNKKDFWRIRIGDPNGYVSKKVVYTISFALKGVIVRKLAGKNAIIFDFVGTGWRVPIKEAIGVLHLPKELQNRVTLKAFRGYFGSKQRADVKNLGTKIEVFARNLRAKEGVTLLASFDPSLMKASEKPSSAYYKKPIYYLFLAPILALFYFFAKKFNLFGDIGSIAPRYRPPKELTVLEAGLLKDNFVDFAEIKPAIIELANLGYITINEQDGVMYLERTDKESSSLSSDQTQLLDAIFSSSSRVSNRDLKIETPVYAHIRAYLHNSLVNKGYFGSKVSSARDSFIFASAFVGLLTLAAFSYYALENSALGLLIPAGVSAVFVAIGVVNLIGGIKSHNIGTILFSIVWILFSAFFLFATIGSKDLAISLLLMVVIISAGAYMVYRRMNTLTFKGLLAKRHLLGLKEFIDKAQKDKIKFFLKEDKHYLDKLLPYAMLFGLNKHWLKLYQELQTPLPTWYNGDIDTFSYLDFEPTSFDPNSNSFDGFTPNSASIDSGDFSDFGGFSGGGFGGGGGDSW